MTTKPCPNKKCKNRCDLNAKQCLSCLQADRRNLAITRDAALALRAASTPAKRVEKKLEESKLAQRLRITSEELKAALRTIERQDQQLQTATALSSGIDTFTIRPAAPKGTSEATVVVVASDWHIEENVGPEVGSLNVFNLEIAKARAEKFFVKTDRLTNLLAQDVKIDTMVLGLLGDFITGNIHGEETAEKNETTPTHAIVHAQNWIASGIEFLLSSSKRNLVIPCHSGNHARTTLKTRFGSENGHSLEFLMFHHLAAYFRNEPRVQFIIPEGPHSYLQVYDQTIRFQHGHMVKYGGGVGGLYIPVHKAIAAWNQARHADLDVMGHFHQSRDGGSFIVNGSLVGYNAFALSIKASYEPPRQTLFLMDKRRGRTCTWPIMLSDSTVRQK